MMILDVLMMLGNGVDCDVGEVVVMRLRRDGFKGLWGDQGRRGWVDWV